MRGHRIPVGAGLELRKAHHELAAVALAGQDELVDGAHVAVLHLAEMAVVRVLEADELRGELLVRGIRGQIELGRLLRVLRREKHLLRALADVQHVVRTQDKLLSVHRDGPFAADVEHAQLAAFAEVVAGQLLAGGQSQGLRGGHGKAGDAALDFAIHEIDLALFAELRVHERRAQLVRRHAAVFVASCGVSDFHAISPLLS